MPTDPTADLRRRFVVLGGADTVEHTGLITVVSVPGVPQVKRRPRFNSNTGRAYSDPENANTEKAVRTVLTRARGTAEPLTGPVVLVAQFWMPDEHVVDVDNLLKHLLDAAQGALYVNDAQVVEQTAGKYVDRENPRTVLIHGPTNPRPEGTP